jgi:MFS transporter, FHS family, L-fucose permease
MMERAESRQSPSRLLWVLFAAYFTFGMITNVLGVIIPVVIQEYRISLFAAGLLVFAFYISYGFFSIPTGLLMDRFGARPLVLTGVVLMTVGCAAVSLARTYSIVAAMIFAVGVGVTVLQTAGNPLIERLDRPGNYHRNLTLTIGFCGIGAFAGPFLLAFIQGTGQPWRRLYLYFAALCVAVLGLLALSRFPDREPGSAQAVHLERIPRLLRNPIVLSYSLGVFFYVGAEVGTASWIVKFFERVHGLHSDVPGPRAGRLVTGLLPALPALTVSMFWGLQGMGRLVSGAAFNKFGSRTVMRLYALLSLVCLVFATLGPKNVTAAGFAACGFFTSVLITLIFSGAIHTFPANEGSVSGILCTAAAGAALIPPAVGWVGDHFGMRAAMAIPVLCLAYVVGLSIWGKAKYE